MEVGRILKELDETAPPEKIPSILALGELATLSPTDDEGRTVAAFWGKCLKEMKETNEVWFPNYFSMAWK